MKRILLLFFICNLLVVNIYAQINNNHFLAETSLNYFHKNSNTQYFYYSNFQGKYITYPENIVETNFLSATKLGYTLTNNFAVGISFQFTSSKIISKRSILTLEGKDSLTITRIIKTSDLAPGIYTRKFFKLKNKFYLASTFNVSYHLKTYEEEEVRESLLGIVPSSLGFKRGLERTNVELDLSASFLYRIKNSVAVQIKILRVNYSFMPINGREDPDDFFFTMTVEEKKPLDLDIDISPINWEYGVMFIF